MNILFALLVVVWLLCLTVSRVRHQWDENRRFDRLNARVDREEVLRGRLRRETNAKLHKQRARLFRLVAQMNPPK